MDACVEVDPGAGEARLDRIEFLRRYVDVANCRGLEVGPLARPVVTPGMGEIYYADHLATKDLREAYEADPAVDEHQIVEVDFVWAETSIADVAAGVAPFDYAVAVHVLEHVPDAIGWLAEVADVLKPGGRLVLVMPDRRVSFDVRRRPSDISQLVEAYLVRRRRPGVAASFDHFSRYVAANADALWHGRAGYSPDLPIDLARGWEAAERAATTEIYVDTHCWVFSDREFIALIGDATRLGLVNFRIVGFTPTIVDGVEFAVVLERLDPRLPQVVKIARGLNALPPDRMTATVPVPEPEPDPPPISVETLSSRELDLIVCKRAVMTALRTPRQKARSFWADRLRP